MWHKTGPFYGQVFRESFREKAHAGNAHESKGPPTGQVASDQDLGGRDKGERE